MSTFRVKKRENPFVQIDKTCINDTDLSWKAKGILVYLLSLPDDWQIYEQEIAKHSKDGIKSTRSGIKELIASGYIQRIQLREDGKFKGYEYRVYENPAEVPKAENGNAADMTKGENDNRQNAEGQNAEGHTTNNNLTNNYNTDNDRTEKSSFPPSDNLECFFSCMSNQVGEVSYKTFIEPLELKQTENKITVIAPSDFVKGMILNQLLDKVKRSIKTSYGIKDIEVITKGDM